LLLALALGLGSDFGSAQAEEATIPALTSDRLYDWNAIAQVNFQFGAPRGR